MGSAARDGSRQGPGLGREIGIGNRRLVFGGDDPGDSGEYEVRLYGMIV